MGGQGFLHIYKRLCLVLEREVFSCGGGGISWPSILEVVKLEVGNMSRKEEAHISGTVCEKFSAGGTGR